MKPFKIISQLIMVLAVTSCVAMQRPNPEAEAWRSMIAISNQQCAKGVDAQQYIENATKRQLLQFAECIHNLRDQIVAPVATYPDLFYQMDASAVSDVNAYKSGKLGREEFIANGRARFATYVANVDERSRQRNYQNQQLALQRQNVFQNIISNQQAQQAQQQQYFQNQQIINNMNRPITTNCFRNGFYTNCTTN